MFRRLDLKLISGVQQPRETNEAKLDNVMLEQCQTLWTTFTNVARDGLDSRS
jgi:hypothetical protein